MMYKIISSLFLLLSSFSHAQTINTGSFDLNLQFSAKAPQLCNITSAKITLNAGNYLKNAITNYDYFYTNCYANTIFELEIPMGSNPHSTAKARRLPLDGEQGDVKHYALYTLHVASPNNNAVGIGEEKYTEKLTGSKNIYIYFKTLANQNLVVGEYKDSLDLNINYY